MTKIIWGCSKCGKSFSFIFEGSRKEVECPNCGNNIEIIPDRQMGLENGKNYELQKDIRE